MSFWLSHLQRSKLSPHACKKNVQKSLHATYAQNKLLAQCTLVRFTREKKRVVCCMNCVSLYNCSVWSAERSHWKKIWERDCCFCCHCLGRKNQCTYSTVPYVVDIIFPPKKAKHITSHKRLQSRFLTTATVYKGGG